MSSHRPHSTLPCPACGKPIAIKADGTLYRHLEYVENKTLRGLITRQVCPGSGRQVRWEDDD